MQKFRKMGFKIKLINSGVEVVDPYDKKATFEALYRGLNNPGVNVVIAKRSCVLIAKKLKN